MGIVSRPSHFADAMVNDHPAVPSQNRRSARADFEPCPGSDRRDDIGSPERFDVYYGMADNRIGVARLDVPDSLPRGGVAAQPKGKV